MAQNGKRKTRLRIKKLMTRKKKETKSINLAGKDLVDTHTSLNAIIIKIVMVNFLTADIASSSSPENIEYDNSQALAASNNTIPVAIQNRKSQVLIGPILVQLILVVDITRSKLSLLDAIKTDPNFPQSSTNNVFEGQQRVARRAIVRLPGSSTGNNLDENDDEDNVNSASNLSSSTENSVATTAFKTPAKASHKIILQDTNGFLVYGIELQKLSFLSMTTPLGSKLILNRVKFSRGVALLDPTNTTFLGGQIPHLVESTKQQLIAFLKQELEDTSP